MRTRKLLSGLGAAVMSLMMIIPWAVYADSGGGYGGAGGYQGAEKLHPEH